MNNNLYMSKLSKVFDIPDCFDDDRQEIGTSDSSAKVGLPFPAPLLPPGWTTPPTKMPASWCRNTPT